MEKKCNKIIIKTSGGWGANPIYSDALTITRSQINYRLKVKRLGELIETSTSKLFINDLETEKELAFSDLFGLASNASFEVDKSHMVLDGGSIELNIIYDDNTKKKVYASPEVLQRSCIDLYRLTKLLETILRYSSIRPLFLRFAIDK